MIRVFANTQPGVLAMTHTMPDNTSFPIYWPLHGRNFYLARHGDGWVLYKPSLLSPKGDADVQHPVEPSPLP